MRHILFLFFLLFATILAGQNPILGPYTFNGETIDENGFISGWRVIGDRASISDVPNGQAGAMEFFGTRGAIESNSRQTAILITDSPENEIRFRSPLFDFSERSEVWISFHQYYRQNNGGSARVELRVNGALVEAFPLNGLLVPGAETGPDNYVALNLISESIGLPNTTIEFVFTGQSYFWLLDDIGFYDGDPSPKVFPRRIGNYLNEQGYPQGVDSSNWAYVPNQLVIQFAPDATDGYKDTLRQELGAAKIDSCACDFIELWEIDGSLFQSQGGEQIPATGTTGILSNIKKAKAKSKVDGVDLNKYNLTDTIPAPFTVAPSVSNWASQNFAPETWSSIRIAILDTGIDYNHDSIKPFVHLSERNVPNSGIDDMNCLENDGIGWNYVDKNNNPYDDNGHGTHVAGILADSLRRHAGTGCEYEFVAYKTHDYNGVSTLFDVACATFQASLDDIDIINDSWGFFGDSSIILSNAIDTAAARNMLIVSAAGNDGIDLDTLSQYPACYAADNVITVAASDTFINIDGFLDLRRADFSNFSPVFVDVVAPGVKIFSAAPGSNIDVEKSGTSMSTPMVTAEAAIVYACLRDGLSTDQFSVQAVKDSVLNAAVPNGRFISTARNGWTLAYSQNCNCDPTSSEEPIQVNTEFDVFPNPFGNTLNLRSRSFQGELDVRLLDANGRVLYHQARTNWAPGATQSITLPELKAGMYFLQLSGNGYLWTEKLLRF
jgi:hypothetical protein